MDTFEHGLDMQFQLETVGYFDSNLEAPSETREDAE